MYFTAILKLKNSVSRNSQKGKSEEMQFPYECMRKETYICSAVVEEQGEELIFAIVLNVPAVLYKQWQRKCILSVLPCTISS